MSLLARGASWLRDVDWVRYLSWLRRLCDPFLLPIAILAGLVLAAVALSFFALLRTRAAARAARQQGQALEDGLSARFSGSCEELRARVDALAGQLEEVRRGTLLVPSAPRAGFNLSKRSQALRMYRHGEPPDRIADTLEVSPQEIDLLLKVHRIVIKNL